MSTASPISTQPASLFRRLAALIYDGLLLLGIVFVGSAALLPLTGGQAIAPGNIGYQLYLLGLIVLFYGWCWTHGGQTLGMSAWKIRVQNQNGNTIGWRRSLLRLACAVLSWLPCGLGYLWILIDSEGKTWHDRLSKTVVVRVPKN